MCIIEKKYDSIIRDIFVHQANTNVHFEKFIVLTIALKSRIKFIALKPPYKMAITEYTKALSSSWAKSANSNIDCQPADGTKGGRKLFA